VVIVYNACPMASAKEDPATASALPPGQQERAQLPRFGLSQFAQRFPKAPGRLQLQIAGDVEQPVTVSDELGQLPRVQQISDFHCVTTWTVRRLAWGGVRFADFFASIVAARARPRRDATFVILRGQDGYRTSLSLADLLADTVLLADRLGDELLTVAHGAPLRLVAPAHYGYKSVKHLSAIEFWSDDRHYRAAGFRFMDHPRARVALEERGRGLPGWLLRHLYRPLIGPTVRMFQAALDDRARRS
jgi:DMSO/TMAO reductase YedYZ molybdopterin-dependent catalytic subunit